MFAEPASEFVAELEFLRIEGEIHGKLSTFGR